MKKYYVKKDVTKPAGEGNWIEMNSFEFHLFTKSPEGSVRKNNFAKVSACEEGDITYYFEKDAKPGDDSDDLAEENYGSEETKGDVLSSDYLENRKKYVVRRDGDLEICEVSFEEFVDDEMTRHELIADESVNIEDMVIRNLQIEEMLNAIDMLPEEESRLIKAIYLEGMSDYQYSKMTGIMRENVRNYRHRTLEKLRKMLDFEE